MPGSLAIDGMRLASKDEHSTSQTSHVLKALHDLPSSTHGVISVPNQGVVSGHGAKSVGSEQCSSRVQEPNHLGFYFAVTVVAAVARVRE